MALVVIPCGASKRAERSQASELYTGSYFRACLKFARELTDDHNIRILSAKHGILYLHHWLKPYEQRMKPSDVAQMAADLKQSLDPTELTGPVIGLCGSVYASVIREVWPQAIFPLDGVGGLGYQLGWLAKHDPTELRRHLQREGFLAPP